MSLPPNVIRVKRKRVDDAPVTFLQFDKGPKRHRSDADWVYQRRDNSKPLQETVPREEIRPVIHVSKPKEEKLTVTAPKYPLAQKIGNDEISQRKILTPKSSLQSLNHEPRRFHISRSTMSKGSSNLSPAAGISKKGRSSPIVFAERSRKRNAERILKGAASSEARDRPTSLSARPLKKPGTPRNRSPVKGPADGPQRAPLPDSLAKPHQETMNKIANDMNQWVLNEIGANLHDMEVKKKQQQQPTKLKYRPKVPAKSYEELYPEPVARSAPGVSKDVDMTTSEASEAEDDDEDWVIDEYIRVPLHTVKVTINPSDVGVLVLDGEEDNVLFYGVEDDEEEDFLEDDEDENAENHYTADYPEDEVDSDDEYNRNAYLYRANASDDEEFDATGFKDDDSDDDPMILEGNEDDDVTMARIKRYMEHRNNGYNDDSE